MKSVNPKWFANRGQIIQVVLTAASLILPVILRLSSYMSWGLFYGFVGFSIGSLSSLSGVNYFFRLTAIKIPVG